MYWVGVPFGAGWADTRSWVGRHWLGSCGLTVSCTGAILRMNFDGSSGDATCLMNQPLNFGTESEARQIAANFRLPVLLTHLGKPNDGCSVGDSSGILQTKFQSTKLWRCQHRLETAVVSITVLPQTYCY